METRGWLWAMLIVAFACSGDLESPGVGAGTRSGAGTDTDADTGTDAGTDADADAGTDAGTGTGTDAGTRTGTDAGTRTGTGGDDGAGGGGGTGSGGGAGSGTGTGTGTQCQSGPLATPLPGCSPAVAPSTGDIHADCVARINQFRLECQCLPPLERWVDGEQCADGNAEYDSTNGVHASFFDFPCGSGARAQNECPGWPSNDHVVNGCLQAMWDEGPEDGNLNTVNGHYESMATTTYTRVACGFFKTPSGQVWGVQNFD